MWPLNASNTGAENAKGAKPMAKHRNRGNWPVDGHDKNFRNQAVGAAQNWVFLQPR